MTSRPTLPPDFESWLAEHPDLTPGDLAPPWRLAKDANPLEAAPTPNPARIQALEAALVKTASKRNNGIAPLPILRLVKSTRPMHWMAAAAVIVLLIAAGLYLWQQPITVRASYGDLATIELPDGTQIQLNSGSVLTYGRRFEAQTRRVHLNGEAFFDVAQTGMPFVIETFNATVTVLGTSFNVRAWAETPETVVTVETGIVEVTAKQTPDESLRLLAGEAARIAASEEVSTSQRLLDAPGALAWRDGRFVFIKQPLGVMFDEIERWFGIEITASETIREHVHNIGIEVKSAEQLVSAICGSIPTLKLRYRTTANGFEIFVE